jgi:cyclopropane fatty-acyl-phospholipid synthase-like methyltransferase
MKLQPSFADANAAGMVASGAGASVAYETPEAYKHRIARYYDQTQMLYDVLWSHSHVHYGFWDPGTIRRETAMRNMSRFVAAELALPRGAAVLDAGCGIGGTSFLLAEEYDFEVVGLTLSEVQLRRATRRRKYSRAKIKPKFLLGDYMRTGFPDRSFDGIFAIESVCYAEPKERFLAEAFRLLRPGGRLVVCDGFLSRRVPAQERRDYERFLDGFELQNLATIARFTKDMRRVGFTRIAKVNKTASVMPSAFMIEGLSYVGLGVCALPCMVGLFPRTWFRHGLTGITQRRLFQRGTFAYCVFSGTRP